MEKNSIAKKKKKIEMTKYLKNRKLNREKVKQYHDEMITGVAFVNQKESL